MIKDDFQENATTQEENVGGEINLKKVKKKPKVEKKTLIGIAVGVVIVGVIAGIVLFKKANKDNFYTYTESILSSQKGEYSYTFDVRTSKHSDKKESADLDAEDLSAEETTSEEETTEFVPENEISASDKKIEKDSMESLIESAGQKQDTENTEWNNAEGIKDGYWKYPNYRVTISGCTNDTENVEAYTKVSLSTDYANGDFTEIIEKSGKTYLNVGMMKNWLTQSGDAYLVSLAESLPQSAYVSYDKYEMPSRYTDRINEGYTNTSLKTAGLANSIIKSVAKNMGKTGLTKEDKTSFGITISEEKDSKKLAGVMKSLATGVGGVYKSYLGEDCMDEEVDNILYAFQDLIVMCSNMDLSKADFKMSGKANKFLTSSGKTSIDSNFGVSFTLDDTDYVIKASLSRTGAKGDVLEPTDTTVEFDGSSDIQDVMCNVIDYFNPIGVIKPRGTCKSSDEKIKENALTEFAEIVNETGCFDKHLSILNIQDYIAEYINGDAENENTKLVNEFMETMNTITGGLVVEKQVQQEVVEEQYPNITGKIKKMEILSGSYSEKGSTKGLLHVKLLILNKNKYDRPYDISSGVTVTPDSLDTTKFTVIDSKKTETNANNEVLLRAYDNNWDMTKSPTTVYINPEGYATVDLYFTADDFNGKVDLYYDGEQLGTVVAY